MKNAMSCADAAADVLKQAGTPLQVKEITQRMLDQGLWRTEGKTPAASVNAAIAVEIKFKKAGARFKRVGPSTYALSSSADRR